MEKALQEQVERLLSDFFRQDVQIQRHQVLGGGCINSASKLLTNVGSLFVKWNSQCPTDLFEREAESLTSLRLPDSGLQVPKPMAYQNTENGKTGFLVTDFFAQGGGGPNADEQLGRGLARLHAFTHEQFGFKNDNYCGATLQDNTFTNSWVAFFGQQRIGHLVRLIGQQGKFGKNEQQLFDRLYQKLPEHIGHSPKPSLTHGDLWSGNYFHSEHGPVLIDPCAYFADREMDLAMMQMFGGFSQRVWDAYQEAWPLPQGWQQRTDLYMLYHYLNHYYLFGGGYGQQALSIVKQYC